MTSPSDPDLAALTALYARHAPDLIGPLGGSGGELEAAARAHLALAEHRASGELVIRVETAADGGLVIETVTDDMPFLVAALLAAISRAGGEVRRVLHPIVVVRRAPDGKLAEVLTRADPDAPPPDTLAESWTRLELAPLAVPPDKLEAKLTGVLRDVREIVADAEPMRARAREIADALASGPAPSGSTPQADVASLLRWLVDGHFTFLGYRHHVTESDGSLQPDIASGLGMLRDGSRGAEIGSIPDEPGGRREPLVITRANAPSPLKPVHPFYLAVPTFDGEGRRTGEHRFLGSLTVPALYESVLDIPVVERRVRGAIHRAGFPLESYSGQQMLEVISGLPREELFSATEERLHETAVGVLAVADRRAVRLFLRPDPFRRFISCLVYLPRDHYTTSSRLAMADSCSAASAAARWSTRPGSRSRGWRWCTSRCRRTATRSATPGWTWRACRRSSPRSSAPGTTGCSPSRAGLRSSRSSRAYRRRTRPSHLPRGRWRTSPGSPRWRARSTSRCACARLKALPTAASPSTSPAPRRRSPTCCRSCSSSGSTSSTSVPRSSNAPTACACTSTTSASGSTTPPAPRSTPGPRRTSSGVCAAFGAAWRGDVETDRFSALVLRAGLPWREAAVLRAYARYARQIGAPYGLPTWRTRCSRTPTSRTAAGALPGPVRPGAPAPRRGGRGRRRRRAHPHRRGHRAGRRPHPAQLPRDDHGDAAHQLVPRGAAVLLVQDRPVAGAGMPAPRPRFEIFVYSPRVEGVHLRFGSVARGGLRWSDRPRGLPHRGPRPGQGAGGEERGDRAGRREGRLRGARAGPGRGGTRRGRGVLPHVHLGPPRRHRQPRPRRRETVPPPDVVRHDADDSYLVVAADKGTAKFSDIANEVAMPYGFWLGDAFASGRLRGLRPQGDGDHRKGAWESVKRHFRELGVDTQNEEFTVVGVGDMSGDVFGNGMLLSRHIRLLAAFDHRHVFVDPDPDAAATFAERERMFALPGSSWDDYDRSKISAGGGVWPRTAKGVPVGPEMRAALGIAEDVSELSPPELIAAILRAPADLLWNGGIGTYVKASTETHDDAGDKTNDTVRADGNELRVKVVGEGGNLGLTQRGRIEFSRAGGKINTDAIDNSAGVDCSDHEVNIKILLDRLVAAGDLDRESRNALLAEMTDDVAELTLADNCDQNVVLGVARAHAAPMANVHARLITELEAQASSTRARRAAERRRSRRAEERARAVEPGAGHPARAHKLDLNHRGARPPTCPRPRRSPDAPGVLPAPRARPVPRGGPTTAAPGDRHDVLVNEMVDGAGITYAFRLGGGALGERGRRRAGLHGGHRGVRPARAVGADARPLDPDGRVGRDPPGVAPRARPRVAVAAHQPAAAADRRVGPRAVQRADPRAHAAAARAAAGP